MASSPINDRAEQIGKRLFDRIHEHRDSISSLNKWTRDIMDWCMANPAIKGRILRFVDVLPALESDAALTRHIRDFFSPLETRLPLALRGGSLMTHTPFTGRAVAKMTRHMASEVARQFICGESIEEALKNLSLIEAQKMSFSMDVLGEAVTNESEAQNYQKTYLDLIQSLAPNKNISLKITSLVPHLKPETFDTAPDAIVERLLPILEAARQKNITVNLDAEQFRYRTLVWSVAKKIFSHSDFKGYPNIGLVVQAYLQDAESHLTEILTWLRDHNQPAPIRLVKGAYWDSETAYAMANNWPIPVWTEKSATDACFERMTETLMESRDLIRAAIATHNVRSAAHAMALHEESNFGRETFEFQLLYGMADPLKKALVESGMPVRVYAPFGPLIPGMAYLVRRILENTSNESFLALDMSHKHNQDELLKEPTPTKELPKEKSSKNSHLEFANEPLLDFSLASERKHFSQAIQKISDEPEKKFPPIIEGKHIVTQNFVSSRNPTHPNIILGTVGRAEWKHAEEAIRSLREHQPAWDLKSPEKRARILQRAAAIMRERRRDLAALEIIEAGKTWTEADADVTEAIDFLEYYSRGMIELSTHPKLNQVPGEENHSIYHGRGVVAVIAPWNFPLAILTGMTSAALITGNAVIVKPAESTGIIGAQMVQILLDAGVPAGVLTFLPGSGSEIGKGLVNHPLIDMIAFTGSKEVGLSIIRQAGHTADDQTHLKKVVAEMGGKNAIIIDDDADLDEAIPGVLASAFGYQGQKCSACSRVILLNNIYDRFMTRFTEAMKTLNIGDPRNPLTDIGPVIDLDSANKIRGIIEEGKREARLIYQCPLNPELESGYFIPPTLFSDAPLRGILAQVEIFGPVLTAFRAQNFDHAIQIANSTDYGLTAGLYSRSPSHIHQAKQELNAGNIYINRKITGAMVGRQPFGGFRMSGTGSKAGGLDYLRHFMFQTITSENTLRHGFPLDSPSSDPK